jgi:hypothetical protein
MVIDQSELEDVKSILIENKFTYDDFEFSWQEDSLPVGGIASIRGKAIVKNSKTGVERSYEAGHGTAWVVKFEKDLKAGKFS